MEVLRALQWFFSHLTTLAAPRLENFVPVLAKT
jgi:hypothetical protein